MKKYFDVYKPEKWTPNKEREKKYVGEPDPSYWDYCDITEEAMQHPRTITLRR